MSLALPLTTKISQMSSGGTSYRWNVAKFGEGYEQRTPDGINYQQRRWGITYDNITATEFATVQAFADNAGTGQYFTWQPPGYGQTLKWVLEGEVRTTVRSGNVYSVAFQIRQVYDL